MISVICWYWMQPGGRAQYTAHNVNIWASMVRRHLTIPHRIACVTDLGEGLDPSIEIIEPPRDFEDWRIPTWGVEKPQCLRRVAMFAPDAGKIFGERFVCMDIDSVISGSLDEVLERPEDFVIFRGTAKGRPYNGSMMVLRAGTRPQVFERFTIEGAAEAGRKFVGSDQAWITHCLGPDEATFGPEHGAYWYRSPAFNRAKAKVTFFPGSDKPWGVKDPWIAAHYRSEFKGRCLILGRGPGLWPDAEAALETGAFDAVIASPEAKLHWPGPIMSVAYTDREADEIAAMYGFEEVVFCGRNEEREAA